MRGAVIMLIRSNHPHHEIVGDPSDGPRSGPLAGPQIWTNPGVGSRPPVSASHPFWGPLDPDPFGDLDLTPIWTRSDPKSVSSRLEMLPFLTYLAPLFHPFYIIINYYK